MKYVDVAIIGGGPAAMAAALSAKENGACKVLIIERDSRLGGILNQCIHNGFGLHKFKEELTGPEYSLRYVEMIEKSDIEVMLDTMVLDITGEKEILAVNQEKGYIKIRAKAVVLAMGCRERTRGALMIPGDRPAGIYTAGTAQKLVNIKGVLPGKRIVILGSGDIGLIMARRLTLEGCEVLAVLEIMKDSGGLTRNIVQCLNDFNIPLMLNHTVTEIKGTDRLEAITISKVDENLKPIEGTEKTIECDTLLLSVGLIPENELSKKAGISIDARTKGPVLNEYRMTNVEGIFACGNVVRVHELVDMVSDEGQVAGANAALYAMGKDDEYIPYEFEEKNQQKKGVAHLEDNGKNIVICTICPMGCKIKVCKDDGGDLLSQDGGTSLAENGGASLLKTEGNSCKRGHEYAILEVTNPKRTLTSTVISSDGKLVPVKTDKPIPKDRAFTAMNCVNEASLILPIEQGNIIIKDIDGTDADLIATSTIR